MKFKIVIFVFTLNIFQLFLINTAKADFQEIINGISGIEEQINIPKNKYLKSIKDELESGKQSLGDLVSKPTSFCNNIVTGFSNSLETIISEAGSKICKSKRKTTKCIPKNIYDDVIPELENIKEKLVEDLDENSFYDICENSNTSIGCLKRVEDPEDIALFSNDDIEINGCSQNEIINVKEVNFVESSSSMVDSKLDLGDIKVLKYSTNSGDIFTIKNNSYVPLEVMVTLDESTNVSADIPSVISLPSKSQKYGFKVCISNPSIPWNYKYSFNSAIGFSTNMHTGDGKYFLPFKAGETHKVTQGEMGTFSHFGEFANSIDFDLIGEEFTAMRDGTVVFVKEDSNEGGADRSFEDKANFVWILQPDGSISRYVHLQQNGALVNLGDKVKAGDIIGLSGNTGFTSGPHLHVQVVLQKGFSGIDLIPIRFDGIDGALDEGASYTALPICK